jgi:hypothetical protein
LRQHKLYAKLSKCQFNRPEVSYLGHVVGRHGLKVDPSKISTVNTWPAPKDVHQVRQFLGLANYFRKFIQGYAAMARPLQDLIVLKQAYRWTPQAQKAFTDIKHALTHAPVLSLPDFSKPFTVVSDASLLGTGAVLLQEDKPVAFTSKGFTPAERNYHTTDQEMLGVIRAMKEWRCYLEGSEVTIVTDHNPLVHIQTQPSLNRRQARWSEFLSRFEPGLKWEYRPGRTNMADGVSRIPGMLAALRKQASAPLTFVQRCKNGYKVDPWFKDKTNKATFTKERGLCHVGGAIAVPDVDSLRDDIIRSHHEPVYAGHCGVTKTYHSVRRTFWWPKMRQQIAKFIRTCDLCQRNKPRNTAPAGLLEPLEVPDRRWHTITMDLITCLPKTSQGHDAILVFVDKFSKMTHLAPTTSDVDAEGTAKLLVQSVISQHGWPQKVVTDRDKRFTGKLFQKLCEMYKIHHAQSTSFHPQTDGQTERMNRTLEQMLRHYVDADHANWADLLPMAEFAINNAKQESTDETPFFLNYGQHPLTPVTLDTDDRVPTARKFGASLHEALTRAKKCLEQAAQRQKAYADQKRLEVTYQPGDQVLLSTRHLALRSTGSPKFLPRYIGPFPVAKMVGNVAVKLDLPPHYAAIHPVVHVSRVVKYHTSDTTRTPPPAVDVDADGCPRYEIDKILAHRQWRKGRNPTWQYLVSWKGYSAEHNSWEPADNFTDDATIRAYWETVQGGQPALGNQPQRRSVRARRAARRLAESD